MPDLRNVAWPPASRVLQRWVCCGATQPDTAGATCCGGLTPGWASGSVTSVGNALYDDGGLSLDEDGLTIRRYYFPWAGPKRIPYSEVRHVQARPMGWLTGKGRGWGTAHPGYWFPLDVRRARKHILLVFDLGRYVKPCVTPDDPQRVMDILRDHVPVN